MKKYTELMQVRISEKQRYYLSILHEKYKINSSEFIRQAIEEKMKRMSKLLCDCWRIQSRNVNEKGQICAEILFKKYLKREHIQATSWLPRGAVSFIVKNLNELGENSYKIQISNELVDNIGVLTSCRYNFDNSLEWDLLNKTCKRCIKN